MKGKHQALQTTTKGKTMIRNLRILCIALVAAFAMSAVAASVSPAAVEFRSEKENTTWTGEQVSGTQTELTTNYGVFKCTTTTFNGLAKERFTTEVTLEPAYAECTMAGIPATVALNGCRYVLHSGTEESGKFEGEFSIECSEGKVMEIVTILFGTKKCAVTIGEHSGLDEVTYTNKGSGTTRTVDADLSLTDVHYTQHAGTGFGACSNGTFANGKLSGTLTFKGEVEGSHVGIWVEDTPPPVFHSEASHTVLVGEDTGEEEFVFSAGTAKCTEAGYKGTLESKETSKTTLNPEYAGCTAFTFTGEVKLNGCTYVLNSGERVGGKLEGSLDIACPEGKSVEVIARVRGIVKCTVTIGAQTGLTKVTYTNVGSGSTRDYKADFGITGLKYTQHAGEGSGKCTGGSFENGEYKGSPTVIGEDSEKKQVGIWVE